MMSYNNEQSRRRAEEETWRQGNSELPDYDLTEQVLHLQQQAQSLCVNDYSTYPHQPLYSTLCEPDINGLYQNCYASSSPVSSPRDQHVNNPNTQYYWNGNRRCEENNSGIVDFFGEQFIGMEDTFRSALMQYFSQVDQEKHGLTEDLRKIKDDFRKYEEEGERFKVDSIQKGKIIRKLTENGKLFVKEIERLKDELRDTELQRRQLIAENNELQKKVQYEGHAIPHLEKELKCLSEENQYLKLLADDTKKLSQQEKEIQTYVTKLEQQQQVNKQQQHDLQKHEYAIKKLSNMNGELCLKINELSQYKDVNKTLKQVQESLALTQRKNETLQFEYKKLECEAIHKNDHLANLNKNIHTLDSHVKKLQDENRNLNFKIEHLNKDSEEKEKFIDILQTRLKESQEYHDEDRKELTARESTCRNMQDEIIDLKQEICALKNEVKTANMKSDDLVYEDELRNKHFENIKRQLQGIESQCQDYKKKETQYQDEKTETKIMIDLLTQTENRCKEQMQALRKELQESTDYVKKLEIQLEEQTTREKQLENEILSHVKNQSEMEQEIAITYNTIETLRKSNENSNEQRVKVQQELRLANDHVSTLERKTNTKENEYDAQHNEWKEKYERCESQRNRLQKEMLTVQEKLNRIEKSEVLFHGVEDELNAFKTECGRLEDELTKAKNALASFKSKMHACEDNSFVCCSSVDEWKVDLEYSVINERPYSHLNDEHTDNIYVGINKTNQGNSENELNNDNRTGGKEIKEYQAVKIESTNKTILINKLQSDLNNKENSIHVMNRQIKQLEKDIQDVVDELSHLRESYQICQENLQDKEFSVAELKENLTQLELHLKDKDTLVEDLEHLIEELQSELNKVSKNRGEEVKSLHTDLTAKSELIEELERAIEDLHINYSKETEAKDKNRSLEIREIEEYSRKVNKELEEKNNIVRSLETRCKKLQEDNLSKDTEIQDLCRGIEKLKEIAEQSNTSAVEIDYKQFQIERIEALEEALIEKEQKLKNLRNSETAKEESHTSKVVDASVEDHYEEKLKNRDLTIKQLELKNQTLSDQLRQSNAASTLVDHFDYSFEDEHVVSKQKYLDIVDRLEEKKKIIQELQELLQLFQQEVDEASSIQLELEADETSSKSTCKQHLQLPTPVPSNQSKVTSQRRSSLPPIPGSNSPQALISRPPSCNSDRPPSVTHRPPSCSSDRSRQQGRETPDNRMSRDCGTNMNVDTLRKKLVKLNTELLQKKLDVSSLEEELKNSKRKQVRSEEMYRNIVSKNESLEHEIFENRREIRNVQNKQGVTEVYETQVHGMKKEMKEIERNYEQVRRENQLITNEMKEKEEENRSIQRRLDASDLELNHWKHHVEVLEKECQKLTTTIEGLQNQIANQNNTITNFKLDFDVIEKEKESWQNTARKHEHIYEDVSFQNNSLKEEILQKLQTIEKQKQEMKVIEQERAIFELKVRENEAKVNDLRSRISHVEIENVEVLEANEHLRKELRENAMVQQGLTSEKELAAHNIKYLENKLAELKQKLKVKDDKLTRYRENIDGNDEQISSIMEEISTSTYEVQRLTNELENEQKNISRVEKLNDDINRENKRLMHELIGLQDRLKVVNDENVVRREKMAKMEHEQSDLENLLLKTQKSNSELLSNNKLACEELRVTKKKVTQLETEVEKWTTEKCETERQLLTAQKELDVATEKLSTDNQSLLHELHEARRIIRELEAILDQGQLDFDEMDVELGRHRKENMELDQKLHDVLKQQITLQSEREEFQRRNTALTDEINHLKDEIENGKKKYALCSKDKDDIDGLLHECKTREEFFEERLRGLEKMLNSKEETLITERREKEKMQDDLVKLQSELIQTKTNVDHLRTDREKLQGTLLDRKKCIEAFERSEQCLLSERDELKVNIEEYTKTIVECEKQINEYKQQRDDAETLYQDLQLHIQVIEAELEDEKLKRHNKTEELLTQVSNLKRNVNEKDVMTRKQTYQQITADADLKTALENNVKLQEELIQIQNEKTEEKDKLLETVGDFKEQLRQIEQEKTQEVIQLKATMDALDDSRAKDLSLLKLKLQEVNELKHCIDLEHAAQNEKDAENEALKEDIIQLQTALNLTEARNNEMLKEIEEKKAHISYLETNKQDVDVAKRDLLERLKTTEESLKSLKEQNEIDHIEKQQLITEKERMQVSFDHMLQTKQSDFRKLEVEIGAFQKQLMALQEIKEENENLKSDLEALLNERTELQNRVNETSQLRSDVFNLRSKADRVQELLNENRLLKHDLNEIKSKHVDVVEKYNRENAVLRRSVDDLFKRNQDLELRNVSSIRTPHFESTSPKFDSLKRKPKSASVDNIHEVGFDTESFSPMKNGVATSTPTQERQRFTSSVFVTRTPSVEAVNSQKQIRVSSMENLSHRDQNQSYDSYSPQPLQRDNQLSTGPLVKSKTMSLGDVNSRKADASWNRPQDESMSSSIKSNPFLQRDRTGQNETAASPNWRTAVASTKTTPTGYSPTKTIQQRTNNAFKFDMRPRSTNVPDEQASATSPKPLGIGNEYVNRVKATFEKNY